MGSNTSWKFCQIYFACCILLLGAVQRSKEEKTSSEQSCFIKNKAFQNQYLYSVNKMVSRHLSVRSIYLSPLNQIKDRSDAKWTIVRNEKKNNTFFIRSNKYNDYLCAFDNFMDLVFNFLMKIFKFAINKF